MKFKRKLLNILSTTLIATAYIYTIQGSSFFLYGETKIPDELMK